MNMQLQYYDLAAKGHKLFKIIQNQIKVFFIV